MDSSLGNGLGQRRPAYGSTTYSYDDWSLNFDSLERSRQRKAAAKRVKSFSVTHNAVDRPARPVGQQSFQSVQQRNARGVEPRLSAGHLYTKALYYSHPSMPHYRQSYTNEESNMQRMPFSKNEYSLSQQKAWQDLMPQQQQQERSSMWDKHGGAPWSSYSDLSDRYGQDSGYHSRHNSSVDVGDSAYTGSHAVLNFSQGPVHGRFPSWSENGPQASPTVPGLVTHKEEIVSPQTARRIFKEAAARNTRPWTEKANGSQAGIRPVENYQAMPKQERETRALVDAESKSQHDWVNAQPLRAKSFSISPSQPNNLASMTKLSKSSVQHLNRSSRTGAEEMGLKNSGNSITVLSKPFYNTMTQTETGQSKGQWISYADQRRQGDFQLDQSRQDDRGFLVSPVKPPTKDISVENAVSLSPRDAGVARKGFNNVALPFYSSEGRDVSPGNDSNDQVAQPRLSDGDAFSPVTGFPMDQTSIFRRLSKEFYKQKPSASSFSSRTSFTGDSRHLRLGSIDENAQSCETSNFSAGLVRAARKSSSEVDRLSRGSLHERNRDEVSPRDSSLSPEISDITTPLRSAAERSAFVDSDEDLGDGTNFVRHRNCQMSLRKAFGIFDEFEVLDSSQRKFPESSEKTSQSVRNNCETQLVKRSDDDSMLMRQAKHSSNAGKNKSLDGMYSSKKYNVSSSFSLGFGDSSPNETGFADVSSLDSSFQEIPANLNPTTLRSKSVAVLHSRSEIPRQKSGSLTHQMTAPAAADYDGQVCFEERGTSAFYTGTGVSSNNDSNLNVANPDMHSLAEQASDKSISAEEICLAGDVRDRVHNYEPLSTAADFRRSNNPSAIGASDNNDVLADDMDLESSTPPPVLPPRQYRSGGSSGDAQGTSSSTGLAPMGTTTDSDFDADSTLKRESYAQQLRQKARRSSYLHRAKPPPIISGDGPASVDPGVGGENQFEPERDPALCPEKTVYKSSITIFSPQHEHLHEGYGSEEAAPEPSSSPWGKQWHGTFNDPMRETHGDDSYLQVSNRTHASDSFTDIGMTSPPASRDAVFHFSNAHSPVNTGYQPNSLDVGREASENQTYRSNFDVPGRHYSHDRSVLMNSRELQSDENLEPAYNLSEVEARTAGQLRPAAHSKKADMAVVQPSVRSTEASPENFSSLHISGDEAKKRQGPTIVGRVKGFSRGGKSSEEMTHGYTGAPANQQDSSAISSYDQSVSLVQNFPPDEENRTAESSVSDQPVTSFVTKQSWDVPRNIPSISPPSRKTVSVVQKSQHKENRQVVGASTFNNNASASVEEEKRLTGKVLPSPQHRTAADYMTGLFREGDENSAVTSDTLTRASFQRASLRNRLLVARQNREMMNSFGLQGENPSLNEIPLTGSKHDFSAVMSEEEKLELIKALEKKLLGLKEERQLLREEISENNALGEQVTAIVVQRLGSKELSKYRSYVDELEKVLYLLLKMSDRLAKAENAIRDLPQNASDKEKALLVSKRNDLMEKHSDALSLKEGIDRRRHQVAGYLQNCLSADELKDYEYFIKMKAQLVIDQQEVEDKIEMGERQLVLLKRTLDSDVIEKADAYVGPKSDC